MAAKIPQDVTREDRLIGPLTLKQFLYLLFGGAIIFISYQYYTNLYLYFIEFVVISFIAGSLALALAFAKINGRPFITFVVNLIGYIFSPKQLAWDKADTSVMRVQMPVKVKSKDDKPKDEKKTSSSQLELLAQVLDTGGKMNEELEDQSARVGTIADNVSKVDEPDVDDVLTETD